MHGTPGSARPPSERAATRHPSSAAPSPATARSNTRTGFVWRSSGRDSAKASRFTRRGGRDAEQEREREEREAVRGIEGRGDVEGAGGSHCELARRVEPGREELGFGLVVVPGRDDGPEEGGRPQGRQG